MKTLVRAPDGYARSGTSSRCCSASSSSPSSSRSSSATSSTCRSAGRPSCRVVAWLWLVLWGAAFVLKDREEIRFDLLSSSCRARRARRAMGMLAALAIIVLFAHVAAGDGQATSRFMKVESTAPTSTSASTICTRSTSSSSVAVIVRYSWRLWRAAPRRRSGPSPNRTLKTPHDAAQSLLACAAGASSR